MAHSQQVQFMWYEHFWQVSVHTYIYILSFIYIDKVNKITEITK